MSLNINVDLCELNIVNNKIILEYIIESDDAKNKIVINNIIDKDARKLHVQNIKTREVETVTFEKRDGIMAASMPTVAPQGQFHVDVLILILLFAGTMILTQKVMMASNKNTPQDPMQAQMQKMMGTMMPIMIIFMFIIAPIPAGVLLYLVISNIIQIVQTIFHYSFNI